MRRLYALATAILLTTGSFAQWGKEHSGNIGFFNHLELGVTAGSTGIGLDAAMPVGNVVRLRAGFTYMPKFEHDMNFGIQVGDEASSPEEQHTRFQEMADMLEKFTGASIDNNVRMIGEPTFSNFKLLVDVYPFRNKHWYLTGGFYVGGANIARACNAIEEGSTLFSVTMYNHIADKAIEAYETDEPFISMGGTDIYISEDYYNKLKRNGRAGVHVGRYKQTGKYYLMEPDKDNTVRAKVKVNRFRPYIGFGYNGAMLQNDDRLNIGFDCGIMMWGGTPSIITHDGTDLAKDVYGIGGKVGDYVKLIKGIKAYPTLNLRVAYRIF